METLSSKNVVARKNHKCDYCFGDISIKEKYHRSNHVGDGIYTWKAHLDCNKLAKEARMFKRFSSEEGLTQNDFIEGVEQLYYELNKSNNSKEWNEMFESVKDHFLRRN